MPFTEEIKNLSRQIYNSAPGNTGWMMWDEPRRQHFEKIAVGANWYREQYPYLLVYSNVYSAGAADGKDYYDETFRDANGNYPAPPGGSYSYDQYLTDYLTIVKPDVLLVDAYPYPTNTNDFIPTRYFLTLEKIVGMPSRQIFRTGISSRRCKCILSPAKRVGSPDERLFVAGIWIHRACELPLS